MSYRLYLESGALRQMHGLPEQAFDMLMTLLARICDDPYDPVFSAPTGVPRRRVADVGNFGFIVYSRSTKPLVSSASSSWSGRAEAAILTNVPSQDCSPLPGRQGGERVTKCGPSGGAELRKDVVEVATDRTVR